MTICGLLLIVGGGSFFIYESFQFANQAKSDDALMTQYKKNYSSSNHRKDKDQVSSQVSIPIVNGKTLFLGLGTHLFVKVPRPGDSEVTFLVFQSSFHLFLPLKR